MILFGAVFIILSVLFTIKSHDANPFFGLVIFPLAMVIFVYPYLKLHEIYIENDEIIIRNLFRRRSFKKDDSTKADSTWIPFIFKLQIEEAKNYYFIPPEISIIRSFTSFKADYIKDVLNEKLTN